MNETAAFVETYGVGVCRGRYADALRLEWHAWDVSHGSENEAVDCFTGEQLFVVFVVADGGTDLEHFSVRSFEEARSILLQVRLLRRLRRPPAHVHHVQTGSAAFRSTSDVSCRSGSRAAASPVKESGP